MRYILYARKSSESEDRQVQSVDDQLRVLRDLARRERLTVVAELTESRSAKDPGKRPVFLERELLRLEAEADHAELRQSRPRAGSRWAGAACPS
jgi:hypothetical protein